MQIQTSFLQNLVLPQNVQTQPWIKFPYLLQQKQPCKDNQVSFIINTLEIIN